MQKSIKHSYLAGFLDGDGSIYVRLKPNVSYRYGYQVDPYIVLFQSAKQKTAFIRLCAIIPFGMMRERKDGILEYAIHKAGDIREFLSWVRPYVILKKKQVALMEIILKQKARVSSASDFRRLMKLIQQFQVLNYSKNRKTRTLTP